MRIVDRVAYINHDIDDAVRHGILDPADLPQEEVELLGPKGSKRIDTLVHDLVETSEREGDIRQSEEIGAAMLALRSFMFERVYLGPHTAEEHERARASVRAIFEHLAERGDGADRDRRLRCRHDRSLRARLRGRPLVARIKDESVEAVKAAANIVELVEAKVRLRKVGGRYSGLCPFHQEKTPSFSVSPDRGTYHCFGCGVGGDSISFVRETESLDFVGAIEWLAERFRVPLEYEDASPEADAKRHRRQRLYALLDQAASFYERVLWETPAGEPVREYLTSRGLGEEVCREFRLGLSPAGAKLRKGAGEKGFTREELAAAGLLSRRGGDYFERRLMFPLTDARGRIVGFQARKLHEDDPLRGKYVNSPESELFRKSNVLYGLHLARAAISKEDRALVVEGNTDVIALRQAGVLPVVASMGTALTEAQLKELGRLTRRLFLCFDSDAAGEDATLRGMELAAEAGLRCSRRGSPTWQGSRGRSDRLRAAPRCCRVVSRSSRAADPRPHTGSAARLPRRFRSS